MSIMRNVGKALVKATPLFIGLCGLFLFKGKFISAGKSPLAWTVEYDEYGNQIVHFIRSFKDCPDWAKSMWTTAFGGK